MKFCCWTWFACPDTFTLYQWYHDGWLQYHPLLHWHRYVIYSSELSSHIIQIPTTITPATPQHTHDAQAIILLLPIHHWQQADPKDTPIVLNGTPDQNLIQCMTSPPSAWEKELWHRIQCYSQLGTLYQTLTAAKLVIICSDATLDGASTFLW